MLAQVHTSVLSLPPAPALAAPALAQVRPNPTPGALQEPSPEPSTPSSRTWGALHPNAAPRDPQPSLYPPNLLLAAPGAQPHRGDTPEPFPSCPGAAFALTHPDVSHSPPHTYSIITSALAPLWGAYLTPNPSQSSPERRLFQKEKAKSLCWLLLSLCSVC